MRNYTSNLNTVKHCNHNYENFREEGISIHGVIISILAGIICQMSLYMIMDVNIFDLPIMFTILLWIVFAGFTGLLMDYMGV